MAIINGTDADETLTGTSADDVVTGEGGNDTLFGGGGNDAIFGYMGSSLLIGGMGNDTLTGSIYEANTLWGGVGDDLYDISNQSDLIYEFANEGKDTILSSDNFSLFQLPHIENLVLRKADYANATYGEGNAGANSIVGNDNVEGNMLVGVQGSDTIVGGIGNDLIFGAQATEKLGTLVLSGVDLSSLVMPDINGNYGLLGVVGSDGAMVAQVDDPNGTYFVKISKTGVLDSNFGYGGVLAVSDVFGDPIDTGVDATNASVAMLADGKFLVSGLYKNGQEAYARLTVNGALDESFGSTQIGSKGFFIPEDTIGSEETILAQFGNGVDGFLVAKTTAAGTKFQIFSKEGKLSGSSAEILSTDYDFSGLAIDPNVQVQGSNVVIQGVKVSDGSIAFVRLLGTTGVVDSSKFGTAGYLIPSTSVTTNNVTTSYDYSNASFEVRSTGIYVTGITATTADVIQDAVISYSVDGKSPVVVKFAVGDNIQDVQVLSDGRVLEVINAVDANTQEPLGTQFKIYGANSQLFISSAVFTDYFASLEELNVITQTAAKTTDPANLIIGGWDSDSMSPVFIRLNGKTGALDTTFGDEGYFKVDDLVSLDEGVTLNFDNMDLQALSGGQFLVTGIKQMDVDGERALVVRLTKDGQFDTTFGVDGVLSSEPGEGGVDFRVLSNGGIVLVDGSPEGSSATLYTKDGKVDPAFGSDPAGADSLVGGAGDDTIFGGAGVATMDGGLGNDYYVVNNSATVIRESTLAENGTDTVVTSVNYTLGGGLETLIGMGDFGLSLSGNAGANSIEGTYGNDTIIAGAGDTVSGGGGRDRYIVQDISAVVEGNEEGLDTLLSASSYDLNNATNIANLIYTGTAGATLTGNGGAGSIIGGAGADTLRDGGDGTTSEFGATTLVGGAGNDRYEVSNSEVVILEAATGGTDTVVSRGDYSLSQAANAENLILSKEEDADATYGEGNAGANSIVGNDNIEGNMLVGLQGNDTILGGAGNDMIFAAQASARLGTIVVGGLDLSSLVTPDIDGDFGFLGVQTLDGAMVAHVQDVDGTYFIKVNKTGVVDAAFGNGGSVTPLDVFGDSAESGVDASMASVTMLADGKFFVSGLTKDGEEAYGRVNANGILDTGFGTAGFFVPKNSLGSGEEILAVFGNGVDGFLVAKTGSTTLNDVTTEWTKFQVFSKDGSLVGAGTGELSSTAYDFSSLSMDPNVQVQGSKGVVIVGAKLGVDAELNPTSIPVLLRLNTAGGLDTNFGANGYMTLSSGSGSVSYDYANASFEVRSNAIYVAGVEATSGETSQETVMSFSADGKIPVVVTFAADDDVQDVRILADGRILGAINVVDADTQEPVGTRFKIYGANSQTFVSSAVLPDYFSSLEELTVITQAAATATDPANVIIGGWDNESMSPVSVRLIGKTGALDTSFGVGGYFQVADLVSLDEGVTLNFDDMNLQVVSGGQFLVTGITQMDEDGERALVVRLTKDGKFDTTFGVNGVLSSEVGAGLRVLSNGTIIEVGADAEAEADFSFVTLYNANGKVDTAFGSDPTGADSLIGGAGNDTLVGGAGAATMDGGLGDDFYFLNNSATVIRESTLAGNSALEGFEEIPLNGIDTVATSVNYTLGGGLEDLIGMGAFGLSLAGNSAANYIEGTYGNDTIFAGAGDTVFGGGGRDRYIVQDITAVVEGNEEGLDTLLSATHYDLNNATNISNLIYTGTAGATLTGNGGAGSIIGGAGADTLRDGGDGTTSEFGATTLVGGAGNDRYEVSNSEVVILEAATGGTDMVVSDVDYSLSQAANIENLVLSNEEGAMATYGEGNTGANSIIGNDNGNALFGLQGADTIRGGSGNDLIFGANRSFDLGCLVAPLGVAFDQQTSVSILKDGSLIVSAKSAESGDWVLARYTKAGLVDNTFGTSGVLTIPSGVEYPYVSELSDGKLSISGGINDFSGKFRARYSKNGQPDMTYGVGGVLTIPNDGMVSNLVTSSDGLTYAITTEGEDTQIRRFSANGALESAFGGSGKLSPPLGVAFDQQTSVSILKDGSLIVSAKSAESGDWVLARYTKAGLVDNTFGTSGVLTIPSGVEYPYVSELSDGKLSISGGINDFSGQFRARYSKNGQPDMTYGVGGVLTIPNDGMVSNLVTSSDGLTYAITTEGETVNIRRFTVNGTLDFAFAGDTVGDTLTGGDGNDTLVSGVAISSLVGGSGDDEYFINNSGTVINDTAGTDTVYTTANFDLSKFNSIENLVFAGGIGGASLIGNSLANSIVGDTSNDTINGGIGGDAMSGGAGNDLYIVDNAGDAIEENEDEGIDTVSVTATLAQLQDGYTLSANVENLILGGNASLSGFGNELSNRMTGNSANNLLEGGEGNNTLDGGVGRDTLRAGSGDDYFIVDNTLDVIEDAGGYDSVEARLANYTLADGMESLVLGAGIASGAGNAENNILVGNSVANTLRGLEGNDTLDGGLGADSLVGGNGDDYFIVDNAGDKAIESTVEGGSAGGIDTVMARVTGYTLANGVENLVLFGTIASGTGNSLDNFLIGNAANNSLNAGVGNDTLSAAGSNRGLGQRDTLTGGAGNDIFILADENGSFYDDGISSSAGIADFAYITDFNANQDGLVLSGSAAEYLLVSGIPTGVSGISGTGHYGLFREQGSTDELIAVLKSTPGLTSEIVLSNAQFIEPVYQSLSGGTLMTNSGSLNSGSPGLIVVGSGNLTLGGSLTVGSESLHTGTMQNLNLIGINNLVSNEPNLNSGNGPLIPVAPLA